MTTPISLSRWYRWRKYLPLLKQLAPSYSQDGNLTSPYMVRFLYLGFCKLSVVCARQYSYWTASKALAWVLLTRYGWLVMFAIILYINLWWSHLMQAPPNISLNTLNLIICIFVANTFNFSCNYHLYLYLKDKEFVKLLNIHQRLLFNKSWKQIKRSLPCRIPFGKNKD